MKDFTWAIWMNDSLDLEFGKVKLNDTIKIVEEFDSIEEAKLAWVFYLNFLKKK